MPLAFEEPLPRVEPVGLERYLGDWFLVAHIPTWRDVGAHYALAADRDIPITYRNPVDEPNVPEHSRMNYLSNLHTLAAMSRGLCILQMRTTLI